MSDVTVFVLGVSTISVFSFGVMAYLRRPLRLALTDLCGTADRASFWCAFSNLTLFLFPLLLMLNYRPVWSAGMAWPWALSEIFMLGLLGFVVPLFFLAIVVGCFSCRGDYRPMTPQQR